MPLLVHAVVRLLRVLLIVLVTASKDQVIQSLPNVQRETGSTHIPFTPRVVVYDKHNHKSNGQAILKELSMLRTSDFYSLTSNLNETLDIHLAGLHLPPYTGSNFPKELVLHLQRSAHLLSSRFVLRTFAPNGSEVVESISNKQLAQARCSYTGYVIGIALSSAAVNLCSGLEGSVTMAGIVFNIERTLIGDKFEHHLIQADNDNEVYDGKYGNDEQAPTNSLPWHRGKRGMRPPAGSTTKTRYLEMYVVADKKCATRNGTENAVKRIIRIINEANSLYSQLGVYISIVGIELWTDRNKLPTPITEGANPSIILDEFVQYRKVHINSKFFNDNAQLFIGIRMERSIVGKANVNTMCSLMFNAGISSDRSVDHRLTAMTMVHELGHNFGLVHDNESCSVNCKIIPGRPANEPQHCIMF